MPEIMFTFEVNDLVSGALEGIAATADKAFAQDKTLKKFNAGLGQSAEITAQMGDLARKVWTDGWGESLEDVTGAIGDVGSQMVDLGKSSPDEIEKITKGALDLAEVMGEDVPTVTRAAGQLMKNGLAPDAQSAFDIIAAGATNGANRSNDLLDTFTEYGPAFSAIGIDGPTALGMMNAALDAGIVSTDKAADAINEFGVRAIDGSTGTIAAYQALGLNADEMAAKIAAGGPTAQQAFSQIVGALGSMTDPVAQETAGVALFGSMWEDSGAKAILAMDPVTVKTGDVAGATQTMGDTLHDVATQKVETMKRKFDDWVTSMIATEGPRGDIIAFATTFGPQALTLAGQISMMALAFKGTALAAGAAGVAGAAAGRAMSLAFGPIGLVVMSIISLVSVAIEKVDNLKRNIQGLLSGDLAKLSNMGTANGPAGFGVGFTSKIAGHAAGGITKKPHPAWVGEGGESELIMPLSKAPEILGKAMGDGGGGGVNINVYGSVIQQTDLARAVQDAVAKARRMGAIPAGGF